MTKQLNALSFVSAWHDGNEKKYVVRRNKMNTQNTVSDEIIGDEENNETSLPEEKENPYIKIIHDYIQSVRENDTALQNSFIEGMDKECFSYIRENARKQSQGDCAMIEDNVVFKWARDFYNDGIALKELEEKKAKEQKESEKKAKAKADAERKKILDEFYSKPMTEKKNVNTDDFVQLELF